MVIQCVTFSLMVLHLVYDFHSLTVLHWCCTECVIHIWVVLHRLCDRLSLLCYTVCDTQLGGVTHS